MKFYRWIFPLLGMLYAIPNAAILADEGKEKQSERKPESREHNQGSHREGDVRRAVEGHKEGEQPRREGGRPPGPPMRDGERPFPHPRGDGEGPPRGDRPMGPPHHNMEQLKQNDPEMFSLIEKDQELERKTFEISRRAQQGSKEERQALREEVEKLVTEHFVVRQERRALQLKRMQEELKKLQESHTTRENSKQELIQRRVSELLGDENALNF